MSETNWAASEKLVMSKLDTLETGFKELTEAVTRLRIEMEKMKLKSGIWGLIGSALPVVAGLAWLALKGYQ